MNLNYKLKIVTDRAALTELLFFLNRSYEGLAVNGEALFIKREVEAMLKLLHNKVNGLTQPRSITFNIFQLRAIEYCHHWFSYGSDIVELPQFMQLISSIQSKYNPSNFTSNYKIADSSNVSIVEH